MAKKKKQSAPAAKTAPQRVTSPSVFGNFSAFVAVVSDAQKDAAELALQAYDTAHGTGFAWAFSPYYHAQWDGISEPTPPIMCWMQGPQLNSLPLAAQYQEAMDALSSMGVRVYSALTNFEANEPANTVDSIYASGFDGELPVGNVYAGIAAWKADVGGGLPPREALPEGMLGRKFRTDRNRRRWTRPAAPPSTPFRAGTRP